MTVLTHVQIHFVRDIINHRLLFGEPDEMMKLDKYRQLALFGPSQIFCYIRWRGNEYGTQDWRLFIVKTGTQDFLTAVPGVSPAAKVLVAVQGSKAVKRSLTLLDRLKKDAAAGLESIPESYWMQFQSCLEVRSPLRKLPRNRLKKEVCNAS